MLPRTLISMLAAVAASAALAAPAGAATAGDVVFSRGGDLHVLDADGTERLTRGRAVDVLPAWSPDRRRVAFVRNGSLHVMRADGTGLRRLTDRTRDAYPAWSPDGRRIAFSSTRAGGENELYVVARDGTGLRRLTRTARWIDDVQPAWTPDGRSLVFASNRIAFSNYELFRIRSSGDGVVERLTFWGSGGDLTPGDDLMPDVSPDGTRIAFVSDRDGGLGIWTMAIDGSDARLVSRDEGRTHAFPRFSPDGARILYETAPLDSAHSRLLVVRTSGEGMPLLLGSGTAPDW